MLERHCSSHTIIGMDPFIEALRIAGRRTSAALVQGSIEEPPFACAFHLIGVFDVLEHVLTIVWHSGACGS